MLDFFTALGDKKIKTFKYLGDIEKGIEDLYGKSFQSELENSKEYGIDRLIAEGQWYYLNSDEGIEKLNNIFTFPHDSIDYSILDKSELKSIKCIFTKVDNFMYIQNTYKSCLSSKRGFFNLGSGFEYRETANEIVLKEEPDLIYDIKDKKIYFKKIVLLDRLIEEISSQFKEATLEEVEKFLDSGFISLSNNYSAEKVKTTNKKRIHDLNRKLASYKDEEKEWLFSYIGEYCSDLKLDNGVFKISSDKDLKYLLFGIDQRYYTTLLGEEKRCVDSVLKLKD